MYKFGFTVQSEKGSAKKPQKTTESIKFVVAQFLWYSWVPLTHEFTSLTKNNYKRFSYPTEIETNASMK